MRGCARGAVGVEEQGDGAGVSIGTLQQIRGHDPARCGMVDGRLLSRSLQLPEGR